MNMAYEKRGWEEEEQSGGWAMSLPVIAHPFAADDGDDDDDVPFSRSQPTETGRRREESKRASE